MPEAEFLLFRMYCYILKSVKYNQIFLVEKVKHIFFLFLSGKTTQLNIRTALSVPLGRNVMILLDTNPCI